MSYPVTYHDLSVKYECCKCGKSTYDLDSEGHCDDCAEVECTFCQSTVKAIEAVPIMKDDKHVHMCWDCFCDNDTQNEFEWIDKKQQWIRK